MCSCNVPILVITHFECSIYFKILNNNISLVAIKIPLLSSFEWNALEENGLKAADARILFTTLKKLYTQIYSLLRFSLQ